MITIVLPYYENGKMLERHIEEWKKYPTEDYRAVIIDDGSPNDPAVFHVGEKQPIPIEVYRIKENLIWNVAGARNLGMHVAPDGWCILTDIDHLLTAGQAQKLAALLPLQENAFYTFERRWADDRMLHPHPNSYLLRRDLYWRTGGCDEDWTGYWGAGEQAFRIMIRSIAHGHSLDVYLSHFGRDDISDASTRDWGRRGSKWDWSANPHLVEKLKRAPYRAENPLRFEWTRLL